MTLKAKTKWRQCEKEQLHQPEETRKKRGALFVGKIYIYGRFSQVQEHAHPLQLCLINSSNHLLPGEVAATISKVGNVISCSPRGICFQGYKNNNNLLGPQATHGKIFSPAAHDFVVKSGMANIHQPTGPHHMGEPY